MQTRQPVCQGWLVRPHCESMGFPPWWICGFWTVLNAASELMPKYLSCGSRNHQEWMVCCQSGQSEWSRTLNSQSEWSRTLNSQHFLHQHHHLLLNHCWSRFVVLSPKTGDNTNDYGQQNLIFALELLASMEPIGTMGLETLLSCGTFNVLPDAPWIPHSWTHLVHVQMAPLAMVVGIAVLADRLAHLESSETAVFLGWNVGCVYIDMGVSKNGGTPKGPK